MGRPPGRIQHRPFQMRASDKFLRSVDHWRLQQVDQPSRAEAIRRLVERALVAEPSAPRTRSNGAPKAAEMASHEINKVGDKSATDEERAARKRRLISGPKEFGEVAVEDLDVRAGAAVPDVKVARAATRCNSRQEGGRPRRHRRHLSRQRR